MAASRSVRPLQVQARRPRGRGPGARLAAVGFAVVLIALACEPSARGTRSPDSSAPRPASDTPARSPQRAVAPVNLPGSRLPGAYAEGSHAAVSSAEANATDIGIAVLRRGGNAVDAAVAVGFALGVTHPSAGNIGGGGFMLVRLPDGSGTAIDYREVAPAQATASMFLDAAGNATRDSEIGPLAAGIPGVVAGLAYAHRKLGRLPWPELLAPAVALARDGVRLDAVHAEELRDASAAIDAYARELPPTNSDLQEALAATLRAFRKSDGKGYREGEVWRQPELATTLEALRERGPDAFYRGALARDMAAKVRAMGGIWTQEDLLRYRVIERQPVVFSYRGYEIASMPPPSSGGMALREILVGSEALDLAGRDYDSPERIHLYVEILRRTFADRNASVADPDFAPVPLALLLDASRVRARMADIDPAKATSSSAVAVGARQPESEHTTHFSVVDADGMAVANTYTLNGDFGALIQIPGTGVILNDEMDDFTAKPGEPNQFGLVQGVQNAIAPGKRMLSSMSPTILSRDGQLRAVLGSPGGPTIITTVAQIVMQLIDAGRSLEQAVAAVRIHHQWLPDEIRHEPGLPVATVRALAAMGHRLSADGSIGHANCIEIDPATRTRRAVADVVRYGGKAAAY